MQPILLALIATPIMLALDLTWIGVVANQFYKSQLGQLFAPQIMLWPAIAFYVIYLAALTYFAIAPGVAKHSIGTTALNAAFLGLTAYATYDLTNLATTANWPFALTFVDMAWGITLSVVVSVVVYLIATHLLHW